MESRLPLVLQPMIGGPDFDALQSDLLKVGINAKLIRVQKTQMAEDTL